MPGTDPITGPEAVSTEDLSGQDAGGGHTWSCVLVPIDELSHYGTKALSLLERFGIFIFE